MTNAGVNRNCLTVKCWLVNLIIYSTFWRYFGPAIISCNAQENSPCNLIARSEDPFSTPPFFGIHVTVRRCRYVTVKIIYPYHVVLIYWIRMNTVDRDSCVEWGWRHIDDFLFRPWSFVPEESCVLGVWRLQVWWDILKTYILCVYPSRRGKILKPLYMSLKE